MHIAHTETKYERTPYALTIKIALDDSGSVDSPAEEGETFIMAALHRRYINPAKDRGLTSPEAIEAFAKENEAEWEEFPLYLYDHSGTVYRVSKNGNPFSCKWDSGRLGSLFVKKADIGNAGEPEAHAAYIQKAAESFCEVYTAWANGEVYGYIIEDADGEELASCWGFIEPEGAQGSVLEAAREAAEDEAERLKQEALRADAATKAWSKDLGPAL